MDRYLCKSSKELTGKDMGYIAKNLQCAVGFIGKAEGENRWDYWLEEKSDLSTKDLDLIKEIGLVLLLWPEQSEQIKKLSESFDLSKYHANMIHTGLNPD